LSVRETEAAVRKLSASSTGARSGQRRRSGRNDADVERLEVELSEKLGAAVSIEYGARGGRVVIRYHTTDELEGILAHIK
jgi:ParB family chromosome partitioning protein